MVKRKEKGVTLVEVVVSMALIAIISATIFITISYTNKTQSKNKIKQYFINETENVLTCYYSGNFSNSLAFLTNQDIDIDEDANTYTLFYEKDFSYTDEENAVYSLTIDYTEDFAPVVTCTNVGGANIYEYGGGDA